MSKYYLTVGINKYPSAPLNGCVNDAMDWSNLLGGLGYTGTVLLDGSATKQTILSKLRESVSKLRYRDTFVFQYSGHGSWVPDRSGDEADGRDEVLCAYDYESGGLISDDELYDVTSDRAFGSRVIILSDSCHSGSVHRFANAPEDRSHTIPRGKQERIRYLPPALFLTGADLQRAHQVSDLQVRSAPRRGSVLISGCKDDEYSYDAWIDDRYNGAFTYHALKSFEAQFSMKQWHGAIRRRLPTDWYPQAPQLRGTWYQKTFWRL